MMKSTTAAGALLAAGLSLGIGGAALAQTTALAQTNAGDQSRPPAKGQGETVVQGAGADEERPEVIAPVLKVTSIEVIRSTHGPVLDIIRVRGLTSSDGWEEAELVPLTRGTPKDGVLELMLVAKAPAAAMEATGFEPIEAIFPIESSHPYKGVNVHSASGSMALSQLPGYAEGKEAGEDCAKCVGKFFVAKGASIPAGKSAGEVVKEEQLPASLRVIKSTDGIASAESNPNRLTILVSRDGTISSALWD
jgi:hypothetical protein